MQNLDLTKWLEMAWDALDEQDELKRDYLIERRRHISAKRYSGD